MAPDLSRVTLFAGAVVRTRQLPGRTFVHDGIRVRFDEDYAPVFVYSANGDVSGVRVKVRAWKDNQELPGDGLHAYVNPPVADSIEATGLLVREWLTEVVLIEARARGWTE